MLSKRHWIALLGLFAASGCASLIYELVGLQLMELVVGSTAVSMGLVGGIYMGGLCLGSVALPRFISVHEHPLRVLAFLELGVAFFGVLALFGIPALGAAYAVLLLLPATILTGGALPAITRIAPSRIGFFYTAGIAGAVLGCVLAGFYLLRLYDLAVATYTASAINVVAAFISYRLARRVRPGRDHLRPLLEVEEPRSDPSTAAVYLVIGLSGACAMGAEIVWTRLLSLVLGQTVYTFSIILAVFLIGLGIGAGAGAFIARKTPRPRLALGVSQMLLAAAIAWSAVMLSSSLPYWPIDPWLSLSPWSNFQFDVLRTVWAILPATLLWGASFPFALAAGALPEHDPARIAGNAYASNTLGAVLGAVLFGLVLIPAIGSRPSQQLLIGLSAFGGLLLILPIVWPTGRKGMPGMAGALAATALALILIGAVPDAPWQLIASGRRMATILRSEQINGTAGSPEVLYQGEGINSSVLVTMERGQRTLYINGRAEASNAPNDMRLQRLLAELPALVHAGPRRVLVIGFGSGVTAGSFVSHPEIEKIVVSELEPLVPKATGGNFREDNFNVLDDKRTEVVVDDARHFLLNTEEKFDVITSDPIHPWVRGSSQLFSSEYFELCRKRLNPGGVIAQWAPLYESDMKTAKSLLATFFAAFPGGTLWSTGVNADGHDLILLGQTGAATINVDEIQNRLDRPDYSKVLESLGPLGLHSAVELLSTYVGRSSDLSPLLSDAQINTDRNLRLQYIAGMGVNSMDYPTMFGAILGYRRFPEDVLVGSEARLRLLKVLLSDNSRPAR